MNQLNPDLQARSPWSTLTNVSSAIFPGHPGSVRYTLNVPGSKSFTNRALILAALAEGPSTLHGILRSDDSYWCIDALSKLGLQVSVQEDTVRILGGGGAWPRQDADLYIGAAGTTARFLPGALAVSAGGQWRVDGGQRLRQRPLQPLLEALRTLGAEIRGEEEANRLPLIIRGTGLNGREVKISGSVSSQFLSGLLLASPYARGPVTIHVTDSIVQKEYVRITLSMMKSFGITVETDDALTQFRIQPGHYVGQDAVLEADASTACYFFALAAETGGRVTVTNLNPSSHQPDVKFVDILEKMGCFVEKQQTAITVQGPAQLRGDFTVSMKDLSDQALTLAAISPFADGPIRVTGIEHIRGHESDRIRATVENLKRLGVHCDEYPDGFTVHPNTPQSAKLPSYDDHRVAMAFSVLAAKTGNIEILDPGCVSKTCPTFFDVLQKSGIPVHFREK